MNPADKLDSHCEHSLVPRPHPACISLPVLKAIRAGVGFGSGTETTVSTD